MGRKFLSALLAAASIMPAVAVAQDRGERRGPRAERMQQRPDSGANGGNWQQRQSRPAQPQVQAQAQTQAPVQPRAQVQGQPGGWQQRQQGGGTPGGWQQRQRRDPQAQPGGWQRPQGTRSDAQPGGWSSQRATQPRLPAARRDDPRGSGGERQVDRQNWRSGDAARDAYRRDPSGYADRRAGAQRGWSRSTADWNDQRRWDAGRSYRSDTRGGWDDRGGWNRDWRRDSRYDWNRWRSSNRNAFHLPRYYAPYGWNSGYRRFGVGAVLSSVLFAQNYWISDPWAYRLPEADGDFRWVRYYNDAVLVDLYSGEIVDVVNDIFW